MIPWELFARIQQTISTRFGEDPSQTRTAGIRSLSIASAIERGSRWQIVFVSRRQLRSRRGCTILSSSLCNSSIWDRLSVCCKPLSHLSTDTRRQRHSPLTATYCGSLWTRRQRNLLRKKSHLKLTSQWLQKLMPSDPSNLKGWHHLQGHQFRNWRSPDRQRRRNRLHGHKLVIRVILSTGTSLFDQGDCCFMRDLSTMQRSVSGGSLPEVLVILPKHTGDLFLEAGKLVLKIFKFRLHDVLMSQLLAQHLCHVVGLENLLSEYFTNQNIQQEAPLFFPLKASTRDSQSCPDWTTSQTKLRQWDIPPKLLHTLGEWCREGFPSYG